MHSVDETKHLQKDNDAEKEKHSKESYMEINKKWNISPIFEACAHGQDNVVQMLLNHGAVVNSYNEDGYSLLHAVCFHGQNSTIQLLINNGADVNLMSKNGYSPICIACQNGIHSTVEILLKNGADVNFKNEKIPSPL